MHLLPFASSSALAWLLYIGLYTRRMGGNPGNRNLTSVWFLPLYFACTELRHPAIAGDACIIGKGLEHVLRLSVSARKTQEVPAGHV